MTIDIFKGLFAIVLLIALISAGLGMTASSTDVFNYNTSAAEARSKDQQTQYEAEKAAIDLELYRQQVQTETEQIRIEAQKQQKQAELDLARMQDNYQIEVERQRIKVQQKLEFERITGLAILTISTLLIILLIIGFAYHFFHREHLRFVSSNSRRNESSKAALDLRRDNHGWKKQQIKLARQREQEARLAVISQKVCVARANHLTFTREEQRSNKDLPLAE